ncbi:MAG: alanyl-tRNA editing protein [Polyangiaceae bacterium]|nr:alanyl-tRNA editing protein [Polyangiaceae bacterium]
MPTTERLYFGDSFLCTFEGTVIAHAEWGGKAAVVLDRSAFYAEARGQMADRGTLGGLTVVDVQTDDVGRMFHVVEGERPAVGTSVQGTVDRDRRRVHMALHTGQHMLSRALHDLANAATVSSRLGESTCTIDVDQASVEEQKLAAAEDLVNAVIDNDVAVRAFFPTADELKGLPLRRAPTVTENIRVVDIAGFDVSPCGGTHCTRTAQVGFVQVTGVERYKGKIRVFFTTGPRARREALVQTATLRRLGREFSCEPLLVPGAIVKLRDEITAGREALGKVRGRLAEALAPQLKAGAAPDAPIVALVNDAPNELLRSIAVRLTADANALAVLGGTTPEGVCIVVSRGAQNTVDCGKLLGKIAALAGGRGGGRKEHAEGKLPANIAFEALAIEALRSLG